MATTSVATTPPKGGSLSPQSEQTARMQKMVHGLMPAIRDVLPKHVTPERMERVLRAASTRTPKLLDCTSLSLMGAIVDCSQLGLEPNTPLGLAHLIPFNDKKTGTVRCQLIIGYPGLLQLVRNSGQVSYISGSCVFEKESDPDVPRAQRRFWYTKGTEPKIHHDPYDYDDRGAVTHAYAVALLKDSTIPAFEVMSYADIERIRKKAPAGESNFWRDFYEEMAKKTALRRLSKWLPKSIEMARAIEVDDVGVGSQVFDLEGNLEAARMLQAAGLEDAKASDAEQNVLAELKARAEAVKEAAQHGEASTGDGSTYDALFAGTSTTTTVADPAIGAAPAKGKK